MSIEDVWYIYKLVCDSCGTKGEVTSDSSIVSLPEGWIDKEGYIDWCDKCVKEKG